MISCARMWFRAPAADAIVLKGGWTAGAVRNGKVLRVVHLLASTFNISSSYRPLVQRSGPPLRSRPGGGARAPQITFHCEPRRSRKMPGIDRSHCRCAAMTGRPAARGAISSVRLPNTQIVALEGHREMLRFRTAVAGGERGLHRRMQRLLDVRGPRRLRLQHGHAPTLVVHTGGRRACRLVCSHGPTREELVLQCGHYGGNTGVFLWL